MGIRVLLTLVVIAIALATGPAPAHDDPTVDDARCDTWYRTGHQPDPRVKDSHEHRSSSDIHVESERNTHFHGQSGHYVVRNDLGYIEIVGGQAYRGPAPSGENFPGQGGFVQGEVDLGPNTPDADFNLAFFGPDFDHLPEPEDAVAWATASYARACIDAAGHHAEQHSREP